MTETPAVAEQRLWRLTLALYVHKFIPPDPDNPGYISRLPNQARTYGDITIALRKPAMEIPHHVFGTNHQIEHVELAADIPSAGDENNAIERFALLFSPLFDLMQFDMGSPLDAQNMMMIDITPPVAVGDHRPFFQWASPPFNRPLESGMLAIQASLYGELPESEDIGNSKVAAALRWYVKSQGANLLHDQFIFLWIALEILCGLSDIRVEKPYVARCQHLIATCPECGTATTREQHGLTLRKYLEAKGVSATQAKTLWDLRQLMHGEIPFDSKKLENLPLLVQPLNAVVAAGLKDVLGKSADDSPVVAMSGVPFPAVALTLPTALITEEHLRPLIPDSPTVEEEMQS
jgi:hypothetical protein